MAIVTMTQALKKLYKAIVGEETNKNNPTKIVSELAGNWPEGVTIESLSVTENGTYTAQEGTAYSPVTVNVSGGSSDFSTAQVTFINADTAHLYSVAAFRIDSDCMSNLNIAVSEPVTIEVPLYKGKAEMGPSILMNTDFSYTPTATGGVSIVTDANMSNKFVITGDGTITAKGRSLG